MSVNEGSGRRIIGAMRQALREVVPQPALPVQVHLPSPPGRAGTRVEKAVTDDVVASVTAVINEHCAALGVPARPQVRVAWSAGPSSPPRLILAGRRARVVPADLREVLACRPSGAPATPADLAAAACRVAVEHDPSVLVGPAQRDALVARARAAGVGHPGDDAVLGGVLELTVARGVPAGDPAALREPLQEQAGLLFKAGELAEVVMDTAPPTLAIRLSEATLRAVTLSSGHRNGFVAMRRRLYHELGIVLPDIAVTVDETVPGNAATIVLNAVRSAPRPLPAGCGPEALVALVEERVRAHVSWMVSLTEVHQTVASLKLALPDLVAAVLDRHEEAQLSLFARTFVDEQMPVRNAARLMILLLDAPAPSSDWDVVRLAEPSRRTDQLALRPGPRGLVSYTRQQVNEEARHQRPGLAVVHHPRLPADLDREADAMEIGDAGLRAESAAALRERLVELAERMLAAPDGSRAFVAGTLRSRSVATRILTWQYPEIAMLAAEEFPPADRLVGPG